MTHTCAALTLAASLLLLPACDTSKDFGPSNANAPVPVNGVWMLQSRVLTSQCEPELPERQLTVNVVQDSGSVRVFVDVDSDGSFGELVELPGTVRGDQMRAQGIVDRAGTQYHLDLTLEYIVWGSMTGSMRVTSMPPQGSGMPPCVTDEAVTAIKIGNAPLFNLSGDWAVTQTVSFASGPLQALAGSQTDVDWDIAQESDNLLRGVFYVASSDTRRYLGVVNDSQIILGGTFAAWGQEFHITYSTLNANGDDMSGQLLARYGANKEFEIGWNIVAHRPYGVGNGSTLELSSSTDQNVTLIDSRGGTHSLQLHAGDEARVRVPAGLTRLMRGSKQESLLLEPQTRVVLPLLQ